MPLATRPPRPVPCVSLQAVADGLSEAENLTLSARECLVFGKLACPPTPSRRCSVHSQASDEACRRCSVHSRASDEACLLMLLPLPLLVTPPSPPPALRLHHSPQTWSRSLRCLIPFKQTLGNFAIFILLTSLASHPAKITSIPDRGTGSPHSSRLGVELPRGARNRGHSVGSQWGRGSGHLGQSPQ